MHSAVVMLGSKRGGLEQAALDYCEALRHLNQDVSAILRKGASMVAPIRAAGFKVVEISCPQRWNSFATAKIKRALRTADIAILHGNRAGIMTQKAAFQPIIAVVHSRFATVLPHYDAIIALSKTRAESLRHEASQPVHILPNLVRIPPAVLRKGFGTPPSIGVLGRFSPEKGVDLFLDALGILKSRNVDFHARIGGGGGEEAALKARAASLGLERQVTFTGWIEDKDKFYRSIDIFCLPSRSESFSITLVEAMAHGCPVVASRCDGPSEIVEHGVTGLLSAISAEAIADKLQAMIHDLASAIAMGERASREAAVTYALPVVARKLTGIMASVLSERNA